MLRSLLCTLHRRPLSSRKCCCATHWSLFIYSGIDRSLLFMLYCRPLSSRKWLYMFHSHTFLYCLYIHMCTDNIIHMCTYVYGHTCSIHIRFYIWYTYVHRRVYIWYAYVHRRVYVWYAYVHRRVYIWYAYVHMHTCNITHVPFTHTFIYCLCTYVYPY